jgi:flagellar biosynthesis chaperone FliJ
VKGFQFPLERVLSWRQTQQTMAEAALARLLNEHRTLQQARVDLQTGRASEQGTVAHAPFSAGVAVERLDIVRAFTEREDRRIIARLQTLHKAIEDQKRAVAEAARNVKMLERLRVRRHTEWKAELDHELELLTGEWAVAQWRRRQQESVE